MTTIERFDVTLWPHTWVMTHSGRPDDPGTEGYHGLTWPTAVHPLTVGSYELRYLAVAELVTAARPLTAIELAERIERRGVTIHGSMPNKAVADALRWEIRKGRVKKPARGIFTVGTMPKSTKSWICGRARNHYRIAAEQAADSAA